MSATVRRLFGRDDDLAAIAGVLDAPDRLPAVIVLRGEAGIGKTSVWLAATEAASASGYRVLSSRSSEAETRFSFVGLADLLRDAPHDAMASLPPIQRRALDAALLVSESAGDGRAMAAAFANVVHHLARGRQLCIAIDDLQWMDGASLDAVRFALRRLRDARVVALLAVRGELPDWLRSCVPDGRMWTIEVTGLDLSATRALIADRLGARFARPTLVRLWEASRGNPLLSIELAAAIDRGGGTVRTGEELPVPTDLSVLLHARLSGLGVAARQVARVVAELADPTLSVVERAVGRACDAGLTEALGAGVLERDRDRLRFTHPLLRAAAVAGHVPSRRRAMHAQLARLVPSTEERARHLALATTEPDEQTASALEDAARAARLRGAHLAAAELADQAVRVTPVDTTGHRLRRLLAAADLHRSAGDAAHARELLAMAMAIAQTDDERATVIAQQGDADGPPASIPSYVDALAVAQDHALRASVHLRLADAMGWGDGSAEQIRHAELAVAEASRTSDSTLMCRALGIYGAAWFYAGRGVLAGTMSQAVAVERTLPDWPLEEGPTVQFVNQLMWSVQTDEGRGLCGEIEDVAARRQDHSLLLVATFYLSMISWRAGEWPEAERLAVRVVELEAQYGDLAPTAYFPASIVAAHQGRVAEARARAEAGIARAEATGVRVSESGYGWVLGFVELSLGDAAAAAVHLRRAYRIRGQFMLEPAQRLELGDLLEALIALGELAEADGVLSTWYPRAEAVQRWWSLAVLARGQALLQAARGDLVQAFEQFQLSLEYHERANDPFQHARTLLALGRTQRRAKQRGAARATLTDALERFDRVGAPLWAETTRAEIARIGGRSPAPQELTEAERRIADLVGQGRSNREVAAALYLAEHSVEAALTRIYRKLGVGSRAALARLLATKS